MSIFNNHGVILIVVVVFMLLKDLVRVEASVPVKSFTFVVDGKVNETSISYLKKFKYSALLDSGVDRFHRHRNPEPVVVRSSIDLDSSSIITVGRHSFVRSAILAYNKHMHLVVRPDDVWLALITQFSFYVSANAEALRFKFVSFEGKKKLEVKAAGTLHTAPYEQLAMMMTDQIAANIKDPSVREWVLPDFSTTTNTDKVVGAFALMATLKDYFQYRFSLSCGLPKVTILGTVDDWKQIRQRVQRLIEFDTEHKYMEKWVSMLLPVIDHFIRSAEGKPDTKWWNQIANYVGGGSGPTYVSGWITVFMAFSGKGRWMGGLKDIGKMPPGRSEWTYVDTDDIPPGYVSCPLKIDDNGKEYDTEIYAGHIVSKLENGNATIVPQLDWCILVKDKKDDHQTSTSPDPFELALLCKLLLVHWPFQDIIHYCLCLVYKPIFESRLGMRANEI